MKSLLGVILIGLLIIGNGEVWGADEEIFNIHKGFLKTNDYLKAEKMERRFYGMGIIDGIMLSPFFGAPKSKMVWLEKCLENMTDDQVEAIITKYLENNPGEWHYYLHVVIFLAFSKICKK